MHPFKIGDRVLVAADAKDVYLSHKAQNAVVLPFKRPDGMEPVEENRLLVRVTEGELTGVMQYVRPQDLSMVQEALF